MWSVASLLIQLLYTHSSVVFPRPPVSSLLLFSVLLTQARTSGLHSSVSKLGEQQRYQRRRRNNSGKYNKDRRFVTILQNVIIIIDDQSISH